MTSFPILFFAAGRGTRMAPLTDTTPKPLIKVAGKTLLDHAVTAAEGPFIQRRVVNVHYLATQIVAHLDGRGFHISDETDLLRETGGGLRHALPLLMGDPVMTMNTDAVWRGPHPATMLAQGWTNDMDALMLLVEPENAIGHQKPGNVAMDNTGRVSFAPGLIYTGVQIMRTGWTATVDEPAFTMHVGWNIAATAGKLHGLIYPGKWCDVGQPSSIPLAERMLAAHV